MTKQLEALMAKIKKQTESFDTVVLKEDEAKALIAALDITLQYVKQRDEDYQYLIRQRNEHEHLENNPLAVKQPDDSIDYKSLVLQLAEIAHGGPVDIGLLPVTIRSMQQICASPQLPAVPDSAEQRLASAVELLKQSAPHMLADESLKDPDGVLCGKVHAVDSIQRYTAANTQFGGISLRQDGDGDYVLFADVLAMIAAAPKPEAAVKK